MAEEAATQEEGTQLPTVVDPKKEEILQRLMNDPDCADVLIREEQNKQSFAWTGLDTYCDLIKEAIIECSPDLDVRRDRLTQLEESRREAKQRRMEDTAATIQTTTDTTKQVVSDINDLSQTDVSSCCVLL